MTRRALVSLMRRESRGARGRLVFMTACLALGVAAVTGIAALVAAVESAVQGDARSVLAADAAIESRRSFEEGFDQTLVESGALAVVSVQELPSMVRVQGSDRDPAIVELKAAGAGYPLYGEVETEPAGFDPAALAEDQAIAGPEVFAQLGIALGDALEIGGRPFTVVAQLVREPDRVDFAMTFGPRVFLSAEGLDRTGLVAFGSRVKSKRLVRLAPGATPREAARFVESVKARTEGAEYLSFKTFDRPSPGLSRALDRIGEYLGLVALLSLLLGGIGVAQVVRAWLASRTPAIATLKSLGFRPREVFFAYFGHVLGLAALGCVIGVAAGLLAPFAVAWLAPELLADGAGPLRLGAALRGIVLGMGTAAVFSLPPLTAVWRVAPARVLRAEVEPLPAPALVRWLSGASLVAGVFAFSWIQSRDVVVAAAFTLGLAVLVGVLSGAAHLVTLAAGRIPRTSLGPTLRHGVAALARPGAGVVGAAVALGIGTLVVVALGIVGARLQEELEGGTPADAPSVFLVDVQPDQWDGVEAILRDEGAERVDSTPVVMARLSGLRGQPIREVLAEREDGRARWQLTREQRLTWAEDLPEGSSLVEGELWSRPGEDEVSIEVEFAKSMGVGMGDTLTFDVAGVDRTFVVTSLREVDWASFRINFFLLVEPGSMEGAPGWRLAAARLDPAREGAMQSRVVEAYPNVGVLRIRPLMERVAGTLGRIAVAVRLLGGFTVLVGIAILAGAVAASSLRRGAEAALLKALGLTRRRVAALFAVEYGLLGLVAGGLGGLGALALSWAFLHFALELDGRPGLLSVPLSALGTALLAIVAGLSSSGRALGARPIETLRR